MTKEQSSDMIEKEAGKEETGVPPVASEDNGWLLSCRFH